MQWTRREAGKGVAPVVVLVDVIGDVRAVVTAVARSCYDRSLW